MCTRNMQLEGMSHLSLSLVTVHVDVVHFFIRQMRRPNPAFYAGSHENITPIQSFNRASSDHIALTMMIRETARESRLARSDTPTLLEL